MTQPRRPPQARRTGSVLLLTVSIIAAGCGQDGGGPVEPEGTSLQGSVFRAGSQVRLPDVAVTMDGRVAVSDSRGSYRFDDAPVGEVTLSATHAGYLPYERRLELSEGANSFDIALLPD